MTLLDLAVLGFLVSLARLPHLVDDRWIVLQAEPLGAVRAPSAAGRQVRAAARTSAAEATRG